MAGTCPYKSNRRTAKLNLLTWELKAVVTIGAKVNKISCTKMHICTWEKVEFSGVVTHIAENPTTGTLLSINF